jgi:hypothetical protein
MKYFEDIAISKRVSFGSHTNNPAKGRPSPSMYLRTLRARATLL